MKIEAYKIDDSAPAPLLTIVAGPSIEAKQAGLQKKELAERHMQRIEFWTELLELAKTKTKLHERISPSKNNWASTGAGVSGLSYVYVIRMEDAQVELYIDKGDAIENKRIFDTLFEQRGEIEGKFGKPLDWQRLDDRTASRIRYVIEDYGLSDRENWSKLQVIMIDEMIKFHKAFQSIIKTL
jgi:hypothetical protein